MSSSIFLSAFVELCFLFCTSFCGASRTERPGTGWISLFFVDLLMTCWCHTWHDQFLITILHPSDLLKKRQCQILLLLLLQNACLVAGRSSSVSTWCCTVCNRRNDGAKPCNSSAACAHTGTRWVRRAGFDQRGGNVRRVLL